MHLRAGMVLLSALSRAHAHAGLQQQNMLSPGSVCADKTEARFYAAFHDQACPCDCAGCRCTAYAACFACEPPPCRHEAFYECERADGSYFNENTQECSWLPLRIPPFDCPLVRTDAASMRRHQRT